jgi:hypothetical protein
MTLLNSPQGRADQRTDAGSQRQARSDQRVTVQGDVGAEGATEHDDSRGLHPAIESEDPLAVWVAIKNGVLIGGALWLVFIGLLLWALS